jgi:hypothetical protein
MKMFSIESDYNQICLFPTIVLDWTKYYENIRIGFLFWVFSINIGCKITEI